MTAHSRLSCFPAHLAARPITIEARTQLDAAGLHLHYLLRGSMEALRIPVWHDISAAADGLWQHTCLEAFVALPDSPAYHEFNFSPANRWAAYAFDDYRQRNTVWTAGEPPCLTRLDRADGLELTALVPASLLPTPCPPGLSVGLSAVIEAQDGHLDYWALTHPGSKPDFHHRAGFCLPLTPTTLSAQ